MAGPFVHMTVCEEAKKNESLDPDLATLLDAHHKCLLLGAISPDTPYLRFTDDWANAFHNWDGEDRNTNGMPLDGFMDIRGRWASYSKDDGRYMSWLMGYVSHMVTDIVVHPVVNRIVGVPYKDHKTDHRYCEMVQDSILFKDYFKKEIKDAEYVDGLRDCPKEGIGTGIAAYWAKLLEASYPKHANTIVPETGTWIDATINAIDIADGHSWIPAFGVSYKTTAEISSDERAKHYNAVPLDSGLKGNYRANVFNAAVDEVCGNWNRLFDWLRSGGENKEEALKGIILNWNLDTGEKKDWETNP